MPTPSSTLPANAILSPTNSGISRAASLIKHGKLVILPTETVYGIAVNLRSPEARARAAAIKGGKPNWVLHVASPEEALSWVPGISAMGRRLITKALPGPVAFQIKLTAPDIAVAHARLGDVFNEVVVDGHLTIRCPDLSATQQVLAQVSDPVAIIGAGTPTNPGIFELSDLPESLLPNASFDGKNASTTPISSADSDAPPAIIEAALDAGPARYRRSSTVVRIDSEDAATPFSIVRPGVIDDRIIQKFADFTVLFLCSGNTCRSPMASALAAHQVAKKLGIQASELPLRHIVVQSAGLHASRGLRATHEAVDAVKTLGGDLVAHSSQPATLDLLRRADVIYTMTAAHREEVLDILPGAAAKTHRLDPDDDVDDPIGAGPEVYRQVAQRLQELVQHRLRENRL